MKKCIAMGVLLLFSINVLADGNIFPSRWSKGYLKSSNGYLVKNSNGQGCDGFDKELYFDISSIKDNVGGSFNPAMIKIDYETRGGLTALNKRLNDDNGSFIIPLGHNNWADGNIVRICVGTSIWPFHRKDLEQLFLWYDDDRFNNFWGDVIWDIRQSRLLDCVDNMGYGIVCVPEGQSPSEATNLYHGNGRTIVRTTNPEYRDIDMSDAGRIVYNVRVSGDGQTLRVMAANVPGIGTGAGAAHPRESHTTLPNFVIWYGSLWTDKDNGWEEYTYKATDTLYFRALLGNAGDGKIKGSKRIETRVFLSKGKKEDAHSRWVHVGTATTRGRNLEPWETHVEEIPVNLAELSARGLIQPGGVYNLVACVDRTSNHGGKPYAYREEHESDNCTQENIFYVAAEDLWTDADEWGGASNGGGETAPQPQDLSGLTSLYAINAGWNINAGNWSLTHSPGTERGSFELNGTTLTWIITHTENLYNSATFLQEPLNPDAWLAQACFNHGAHWDVGLTSMDAYHPYCGHFAYDANTMTLTARIPLDAELAAYIRNAQDTSIFDNVSVRVHGFVRQ